MNHFDEGDKGDEGDKLDEKGNATVFDECYEVLEEKSDKGMTSKMQDLEC